MVVSRVRGCATSLCQSSGRYPPPHRILKGMIRSQHENRKPFAPNSLKIPTRQHRCNKATTDRSSPKFVTPEERIATFDQDGTTWVSHPMYTQVIYCLERVPVVVANKPELKNVEPFKTVLSGNREAIARLSMKDLEKLLAVTLTGMTVDEFRAEVTKWIATAKHPRWERLYTELTYQPMLEVMRYLRANGFKTYIV